MNRIFVGNRFFERDCNKAAASLAKLKGFAHNMLATGSERVVVAVNTDDDKSHAIEFLNDLGVKEIVAMPVTPWGKFVPALNALLAYSALNEASRIFFASTEIQIAPATLGALDNLVDEKTLVAGLRLEKHTFEVGEHECAGPYCPWNTASLFRVKSGLDRLGIPATGEALFDVSRKNAGVEEVNTINLYQAVYDDCAALLVQAPGVNWNLAASSDNATGRVDYKLDTKYPRPEAQRVHAKLKSGVVRHLVVDEKGGEVRQPNLRSVS